MGPFWGPGGGTGVPPSVVVVKVPVEGKGGGTGVPPRVVVV